MYLKRPIPEQGRTFAPAQAAFTLIEMLVVIAIIALLATLISPAVSRALDRAREITCLSNMQQWGRGVHLYLVDGPAEPVTPQMISDFGRRPQGAFPQQYITGMKQEPDFTRYNPYAWFNAIPLHLGETPLYRTREDGGDMPRPRDGSIWTCPVVPTGEAEGLNPNQAFLSYAYNMYIDHNVRYGPGNTSTQTRTGVMRQAGLIDGSEFSPYPFLLRIQNISDPSKFVVFLEDSDGVSAASHARFAAYRHGGRRESLHLVFADGSARAHAKRDIHFDYAGPQSRVWNRGGIVWFEGGIDIE